MPIYAYICEPCKTEIEDIRHYSQRDDLPLCKKCSRPMAREMAPSGMSYKMLGGGVYAPGHSVSKTTKKKPSGAI